MTLTLFSVFHFHCKRVVLFLFSFYCSNNSISCLTFSMFWSSGVSQTNCWILQSLWWIIVFYNLFTWKFVFFFSQRWRCFILQQQHRRNSVPFPAKVFSISVVFNLLKNDFRSSSFICKMACKRNIFFIQAMWFVMPLNVLVFNDVKLLHSWGLLSAKIC